MSKVIRKERRFVIAEYEQISLFSSKMVNISHKIDRIPADFNLT